MASGLRASRLVEMLVRLQLRGAASASELAAALGVSVRTVYRDIDALSAAGVPVYTEIGRHGGIRIDPEYRIAGLPRLDVDEARGVLFAVVPTIAAQLGFDAAAADRTLLPAMEATTERSARTVRDRLLIEPTHWFLAPDDAPALTDVATAVWECRELRVTYRGAEVVVRPLGLILKGHTWYALTQERYRATGSLRLLRLSRIEDVEVREQRFTRPPDFDLAAAWAGHQRAFLASLPDYVVTVRVAPAAEALLGMLDEGAPDLPLPADVERDEDGWARLRLRFERSPDGAARQLLRLGALAEVLDPPELRARMAEEVTSLAELYSRESCPRA